MGNMKEAECVDLVYTTRMVLTVKGASKATIDVQMSLSLPLWHVQVCIVYKVMYICTSTCSFFNNNNNNNDDDDDDDDDDNNNNNGITQTAFPHSGSSSTWGTNGFMSLSKDGVAKEDHLNIQPHGQAGNRTRDLLASSQRSY